MTRSTTAAYRAKMAETTVAPVAPRARRTATKAPATKSLVKAGLKASVKTATEGTSKAAHVVRPDDFAVAYAHATPAERKAMTIPAGRRALTAKEIKEVKAVSTAPVVVKGSARKTVAVETAQPAPAKVATRKPRTTKTVEAPAKTEGTSTAPKRGRKVAAPKPPVEEPKRVVNDHTFHVITKSGGKTVAAPSIAKLRATLRADYTDTAKALDGKHHVIVETDETQLFGTLVIIRVIRDEDDQVVDGCDFFRVV